MVLCFPKSSLFPFAISMYTLAMLRQRVLFAHSIVALASVFAGNSALAQQKTLAPADFVAWLPISDAERELQAPTVEKDPGAEGAPVVLIQQ